MTTDHAVGGQGEPEVSAPLPAQGSAVDRLYDELSEVAQEAAVQTLDTTLLPEVDQEILIGREREYRDVEKQHVRIDLWLRMAKRLAAKLKRPLRYFTLPSYYRLDVSLFLRENLLEVTRKHDDGSPAEVYVAAVEYDPAKFGRMQTHRPAFRLFGLTTVEDILVDQHCKYYGQLSELFPFDIINLDLTTSLTPKHEGPYSRTMQAIDAILQRQTGAPDDWALFLTFRNVFSDWEPRAVEQLLNNLDENIAAHPKVRDAFERLYRCSLQQLRACGVKRCISQAVAKWIVDRAHYYGMRLASMQCYYYRRLPAGLPPYFITKQAFIWTKGPITTSTIPTKAQVPEGWKEDDLVACVEQHRCRDVEERLLTIAEEKADILDSLAKDIQDLCRMITNP
jgi:hypothetical protein